VSAIECMSMHLNDSKCDYFFKKLYEDWNFDPSAQPLSKGEKFTGFLQKAYRTVFSSSR